jgi:putative hemolysin
MLIDELLERLRKLREHFALVLDEHGTVVGLITLEDVLSELLGNVPDEFKQARLLPLRLSDGRVRLPGALALDQARVWLEDAWPAGTETVASFVARHIDHVPEQGEDLVVSGLPVEVESVDGTAVSSVIVAPGHGAESH